MGDSPTHGAPHTMMWVGRGKCPPCRKKVNTDNQAPKLVKTSDGTLYCKKCGFTYYTGGLL